MCGTTGAVAGVGATAARATTHTRGGAGANHQGALGSAPIPRDGEHATGASRGTGHHATGTSPTTGQNATGASPASGLPKGVQAAADALSAGQGVIAMAGAENLSGDARAQAVLDYFYNLVREQGWTSAAAAVADGWGDKPSHKINPEYPTFKLVVDGDQIVGVMVRTNEDLGLGHSHGGSQHPMQHVWFDPTAPKPTLDFAFSMADPWKGGQSAGAGGMAM